MRSRASAKENMSDEVETIGKNKIFANTNILAGPERDAGSYSRMCPPDVTRDEITDDRI